ncbi:unnamed protein product [Dicrocoelium dendriticum]|nr:unnamed protein product [Dicrocoelium dendriticum]
MLFPGQNEMKQRIGGVDYYDRLKYEGEFHTRTEKHMIDNEVRRRVGWHQKEKELHLNERKGRLANLLQCESHRDKELCDQKLLQQYEKQKTALFERAESLKRQVREKETALAEQKYNARFAVSTEELREHITQVHARAIQEDRKRIAEMIQADRAEQARQEAWFSNTCTHFDEQLLKEEEKVRASQAFRRALATDNLAAMLKKEAGKKQERQNEIEEGRQLQNEAQEQMKAKGEQENHQLQLKPKLMYTAKGNIEKLKQQKEQEEHIRRLIDAYCNPPLSTVDNLLGTKEKEAELRERRQFLEYQKRMTAREKRYAEFLDKYYGELEAEQSSSERDRKKKASARILENAKEVVKDHRAAIARKEEAKEVERRNLLEERKKLEQTQQEYMEKLRQEQAQKVEINSKYLAEAQKVKEYRDKLCVQLKNEELQRERAAMLKAENEYQARLQRALSENPLGKQL